MSVFPIHRPTSRNPGFPLMRMLGLPVLVLALMLAVAGCESAEKKAERYYQSAMTLLEKGDTDRALIELRNVFKYDGFHKEARLLYAETQMARGEVGEAYSQYLRVIEQYPDTVEARIILAQVALERGDWNEVERHAGAAIQLAPEDARVKALAAALEYRKALLAKDEGAEAEAAAEAEALLADAPEDRVARRIAIDSHLRAEDPAGALKLVDEALAQTPDDLALHMMRFRLLATLEDRAAASAELEATFAAFPDQPEIGETLIQWYYALGDLDGAESLLRRLAGPDDGPTEAHGTLIRFLGQARGLMAASDEVDRLIAATEGLPQQDFYRALRAGFDFDTGKRAEAISQMQALVAGAGPSDQTRRIKLLLARMLLDTANPVGARELIEAVLAEDPGQVDGLKMRARLLIDEDKPDAAILDLRAALDGAPRDPQIMALMADAHLRAGSRELAGERLALAVETSNSAPEYALAYARFLMQDGRVAPAESVLVAARNINPDNLDILRELGRIWLQREQWSALQELLATLRRLDSDAARSTAASLEAGMLIRQDRAPEGLAVLEQATEGSDGDAADRALSVLVMAQIGNGDTDAARAAVEAARAERPDSLNVRMLAAMVEAMSGQTDKAEAELRSLIADAPQLEAPVQRLTALLLAQGRHDEAVAVLDAGLATQPDSVGLRLTRASLHQSDGEIDAALALYEALYAQNSDNMVVANNLASLLADYRGADPAALERAYAIARRLQGLNVPAFQDTFGWIEYRRGNYDTALPLLESAAAGLPDDASVQLHLGLTYAALNRPDKARPYLEHGLELAAGADLPQVEDARAALAALDGAAAAPKP